MELANTRLGIQVKFKLLRSSIKARNDVKGDYIEKIKSLELKLSKCDSKNSPGINIKEVAEELS